MKMSIEPCKQGEHKFVARYTEIPNHTININSNHPLAEIRKTLYYKKYLFDICERCGWIIFPDCSKTFKEKDGTFYEIPN